MDIYIKWDNDKNEIHLPVNPESFMVEGSMDNTTVTVHDLGEINLKGKRGLYGINIESFFPCQEYGFERAPFMEPYGYVNQLTELYERNETVHLIITETEVNGFFTIESWSYGHSERNNDVSYAIGFREFRETKNRPSKAAKSGTHTWKKGDTWQKVTKKYLGSSKTWKQQRKNNRAVIKQARKKYPKKKEREALVGCKVVIRP